jgi:hypothetical protein
MEDPNNVQFVQNLVNFTSRGVRNSGTTVLFDRGRNSRCGPSGNGECLDTNMSTLIATIEDEGYTVQELNSTSGSITSLDPNVKIIFLWTPLVEYTVTEINTFKRFAAEGGRIVFVGEWELYYTNAGIAIQNKFLEDMGALMRNTGEPSIATIPSFRARRCAPVSLRKASSN